MGQQMKNFLFWVVCHAVLPGAFTMIISLLVMVGLEAVISIHVQLDPFVLDRCHQEQQKSGTDAHVKPKSRIRK
jgi:hypothetical protein